MTSRVRRLWSIAATLTGISVLAAVPAQAVSILYSYSGSDYSVNSAAGTLVSACDREADNHGVRAEWTRTGVTSVNSVTNNGGNNTCQGASLATVVYKHRIVEVIPGSRDDYGAWVYPS